MKTKPKKNLSLHSVGFKEVVSDLLKIKPPPLTAKKKTRDSHTDNSKARDTRA